MEKSEIREVAGVKARLADKLETRANIVIDEMLQPYVRITGHYQDLALAPDEARRLARQFYRLARRIEARNAEK